LGVVFLGTSDFAAAILARLAENERHRPSFVLTRPDRPRGRGRKLASPPVAEAARELGLTLAQPANVNDAETLAAIDSVRPDAVVVCAFGALIKEPLLSAHELLNVHPSLLPRWRGAAPIERAMIAGDEHTGVSIMRLTAGLDSGPVCAVERESIGARDSYGTLAPRLEQLGARLLLGVLDAKAEGDPPRFVEQSEDGVTYAEKIDSEDRTLDPARTAVELDRVVRALYPHVGARVALADGTFLGVHEAAPAASEASVASETSAASGADPAERGVIARDERLLLACAGGALELLVVQPPGGRAMTAEAYLRGRGLPARA
jgi:methionyl-tRNA formyltransferase